MCAHDKKELYYGLENYCRDLKDIVENETEAVYREFYTLCMDSIEKDLESFKKNLRASKEVFGLSLCSKPDNLTHWDRYADNCRGICIGLNVNAISIVMQRIEYFGASKLVIC